MSYHLPYNICKKPHKFSYCKQNIANLQSFIPFWLRMAKNDVFGDKILRGEPQRKSDQTVRCATNRAFEWHITSYTCNKGWTGNTSKFRKVQHLLDFCAKSQGTGVVLHIFLSVILVTLRFFMKTYYVIQNLMGFPMA